METEISQAFKRVKPAKNKKRVASFMQVFMTFIRYEGNRPIVDKVFSREFFQVWLKTRTGKVKHPEQSFHRTFIAHIRGQDRRRPFSEDIEEELLRVLRADKMIWNGCFAENKFNIGKHGFKHLGFHEARRSSKRRGVYPWKLEEPEVVRCGKSRRLNRACSAATSASSITIPTEPKHALDQFSSLFSLENPMEVYYENGEQAAQVLGLNEDLLDTDLNFLMNEEAFRMSETAALSAEITFDRNMSAEFLIGYPTTQSFW